MVCLGNMCVDTLHKGDNDDNNNNKINIIIIIPQFNVIFLAVPQMYFSHISASYCNSHLNNAVT
jgi:hypothetical protein